MSASSLPVEVSVRTLEGTTHVAVSGEVDLSNAHEVRAQFDTIPVADATILDLRAVPFMDSTGLNAVAQFGRRLKEEGGHLTLVIDRPTLAKVFDITGLSRHFPIVARPEDAT